MVKGVESQGYELHFGSRSLLFLILVTSLPSSAAQGAKISHFKEIKGSPICTGAVALSLFPGGDWRVKFSLLPSLCPTGLASVPHTCHTPVLPWDSHLQT